MPYKCKGIIETVAEDDLSITDDDYDFGDFTDSGKRQQSDSLNNNYGMCCIFNYFSALVNCVLYQL